MNPVEKTWECSCPPDYTGPDCGLKVDLSSRSNDAHQIVMKQSVHSKGRITNEDAFDLNNGATASSFWVIMLIVVLTLLVVGVVLFGYIHMYETDGRMYLIKRNLNRRFNFRNNSFGRKTYDYNNATVDLLDQMECEPEDDDHVSPTNQQSLKNQDSFVC